MTYSVTVWQVGANFRCFHGQLGSHEIFHPRMFMTAATVHTCTHAREILNTVSGGRIKVVAYDSSIVSRNEQDS